MASLTDQINRGVALLQQNQPAEAAELYRGLVRRWPDVPDALHLLSVAMFQLGDAAGAVEYAERAARLNPSAADYWSNLGRYYQSLGRWADAEGALNRATALAPRHRLAYMNLGLVHSARGDRAAARAAFLRHLEINPDDPGALHQWGTQLLDWGSAAEAVPVFCRVAELKPHSPETFNNLGNALQALGQPAESIVYYRQALQMKPDYAEAVANEGAAWLATGDKARAVECFERALAMTPGLIAARGNLANLAAAEGRHLDAVSAFRAILAEAPGSAETWNNLGNSYQELGRYEEALEAYRAALQARPSYHLVYNNIGNTLRRQGRYEEAVAQYAQALAAQPDFVEALNNQAVALMDLGRMAEAIELYERARRLRPDYVDPLINLANVYRDRGRPELSIAHLREALKLAPQHPYAWNNLGCALSDQGEAEEAIACFRRSLELAPSNPQSYSNILLNLHYTGQASPEQIAAEHAVYGKRFGEQAAAYRAPHRNLADPDRPLRIGYVSADFRRHSVAYFAEPVVEGHNRGQHAVYLYADVARPDAITARFQALAGERWRDIRGLNDERFAALVRQDEIDILVDLGAHTANSRLASFTAQPAPVQLTWLGYPNTTGLASIGYRLTDAVADPVGQTEAWHSEELVRLAGGFLCFRPPAGAPPVTVPPPALVAGAPFTFGSFNNQAKLSEPCVAAWARILHAAPGARLAIKNKALSETEARTRLQARFAAHGIGPERLWMSGAIDSFQGHLAAYSFVDLALDTFPYNGTTTTCEALWMGVPVLTWAGRAHVERVGASVLAAAGLGEEFVAASVDDYVSRAAGWSAPAGRERLAALRPALRERLAASALTNEGAFTSTLEQTYRNLWRRWCAAKASSPS
ncbi:MAG: tetratricopeptide repeat protein [Bryobacterales bacterium]|nr:tetratricopeptide repeat protein [Bryobacterales bacterium]